MTAADQLLTFLPLSAVSGEEVEALLDAAFGMDRRGRTAYRLRAGVAPITDLSFAVRGSDGKLDGVLQSWPIALDQPHAAPLPLILVGPVAVAPARQRSGLGRLLMEEMLRRYDGIDPLVLIGDPEYYGRFFGFTADPTGRWALPGPVERRRLLARSGDRPLPTAGTLIPRR